MLRTQRHKGILWGTPIYPKLSSMLIEAATWSGKTFTTGTLLAQLRMYKNRYNAIQVRNAKSGEQKENPVFPDFNIFVLNDRIGLVEQLRAELVEWSVDHVTKEIKPSIFPDEMVDGMRIATYHSKVEDTDNMHSIQGDESVETEIVNSEAQESIHFSTLQTAKLDATREQVGQPNIILIDEADIITMRNGYEYSDYMETLMSYYQPDDQWYYPLIIPITATPDNITKDIFGESVARFGLGEYLASGHGPKVHMHFETPPGVDQSVIAAVMEEIQEVKTMKDYMERKEKMKAIKEKIQSILPARKTDTEKKAYLDRAIQSIWKKITPEQRTLIFNTLISESEYTADEINALAGRDIAIARHSQTAEEIATTLQWLKDGSRPISRLSYLI